MARFDVYRNANRDTQEEFPFLLDVQTDFLDTLKTRVVIPLMTKFSVRAPMARLNPAVTIAGKACVLITTDIAGVPVSALGPRVGSLAHHRLEIIAAVDFLLTGT
jgi:toxin CcdB